MGDAIRDRQGAVENSSSKPTDPASSQTAIVIAAAEGESVSGEGEYSKTSLGQTDPAPSQTVIVIAPAEGESVRGESGYSKTKANVLETSKVSTEERRTKAPEAEKHACVVDIKCGDGELSSENWEGEKVCRICHLSSGFDHPAEVSDLITLGCGCKSELGIAHRHCAEAWFKLRGNRMERLLLSCQALEKRFEAKNNVILARH
uniref:RING-CH-type domain-containing protein n=1 Tax=Nelumbo nucifera TaxID=4432 RepID=A0A822YYQ5_NELNU|nr:TPA_asm: hypothetical protein HUJ06_008443 [Nelumbo nucifera]